MNSALNRFLRTAVPFQAEHPTYEGRPLPHPEEDVEDQGLAFDVVTVLTRRNLCGLVGAGAAGLTLAPCSTGTASSGGSTGSPSPPTAEPVEIPDEPDGPHAGHRATGPDVLDASRIV